MNIDDELSRRMEQARQNRSASAAADAERRRRDADQAAEYDRLWSELLSVSQQCAERLRAARVPTERLLTVESQTAAHAPVYVHRGYGWRWSWSTARTSRAPYEYVSIRNDGVFGRAKQTDPRGVFPDGTRGGFVWDSESQDPPKPGLITDEFTVRDGAIVMRWEDTYDVGHYAPVLDMVLTGTAKYLDLHR